MDIFKNKSIRQKINIIIMLTTTISLLIVSTAFVVYESLTYKQTIAKEISIVSNFVSSNLAESISENNKNEAIDILTSIVSDDTIVSTFLFTSKGAVFASYPLNAPRGQGFLPEGIYQANKHIHVYKNILDRNGEVIGTLYVKSNLHKLYERVLIYVRILSIIILCTFLVALQISSELQRIISDPIVHLFQTTQRVSKHKDYSIRAKRFTDDETGELTTAFNGMLAEVEVVQKKLMHEALHDNLTGLPNRVLLYDRLDRLLEYTKRNPEHTFAILFLDLDRFKLVNDSFGHITGDELLKKIVKRLTKSTRTGDTVARIGGDEFVVLLSQIKNKRDAINVAERIQTNLHTPIEVDGQQIYMTTSIGIAINNKHYKKPSEFLRDADNAMYHAKSLGKDRYEIFDRAMHISTINTFKLETQLRRAINAHQFSMYYQPIYDTQTHKICRLEALLRWNHPEEGLIAPDRFIDLAEETGLIVPIGKIVFQLICKQIEIWEAKGLKTVPIAINFSTKQFEQDWLLKYIKEMLSETKTNPKLLVLEVTENVAINNFDSTLKLLNQLKEIGIKISIDDFGTGFSSLSYLKELPLDHLKIDRSFITHITTNPSDAAITKSIIAMGHDLGFKVVAEGVEEESQLQLLKEYQCDEIQGYYFSKALPVEEAEKLLTT